MGRPIVHWVMADKNCRRSKIAVHDGEKKSGIVVGRQAGAVQNSGRGQLTCSGSQNPAGAYLAGNSE